MISNILIAISTALFAVSVYFSVRADVARRRFQAGFGEMLDNHRKLLIDNARLIQENADLRGRLADLQVDAQERDTRQLVLNMPEAMRVKMRPANFEQLTPEEQWEIDKRLGILDAK